MTLSVLILGVTLAAASPQQGTAPQETPDSAPKKQVEANGSVKADELGVSLDKIQRALAKTPSLKLPDPSERERADLPRFRIDIEGQKLTIEQILGREFWKGPVPYGGMTHQEFLDMVTPNDVKGYAAFSNGQAATVAITSFALQWALKTAIREFQEAKDERAREAARQEVQDALEALRKARRDAGLPDK
jgi:hypothetical protein